MTQPPLSRKLDELFFQFEETVFENDGTWPRRINLVFAFSDYLESLEDEVLADFLGTKNKRTLQKFRKIARRGIDLWLQQNMKTLFLA